MDRELSPELLLYAYSKGIFPMAERDGEILWFCPEPRAIIELDAFHVPGTLSRVCRSGKFNITVDHAFERVMQACADRPNGTWINDEIIDVYTRLHEMNVAHSVETWREGELVGGLYGVALGGLFAGESMFHRARDASKVALVHLVERLQARGYGLLDIQFITPHLARFGATEIPRKEYMRRLKKAVALDCRFDD